MNLQEVAQWTDIRTRPMAFFLLRAPTSAFTIKNPLDGLCNTVGRREIGMLVCKYHKQLAA